VKVFAWGAGCASILFPWPFAPWRRARQAIDRTGIIASDRMGAVGRLPREPWLDFAPDRGVCHIYSSPLKSFIEVIV
jgi:hypothetical protein